jgi:ribosomal protein S18 acetylase RimI-like enzyme
MSGRESRATTARAEDVPELARLMAASPLLRRYRVDYDGALASLGAAQQDGDLLLAARVGSEGSRDPIVGLAWLSLAPRMLNGAAYLRLLLVDADAQGVGLGAFLLGSVEFAANARANHLYLLVTTDNAAARRFYERHGYRHVGDLPGLVLPALDEALYHKALRAPDERLSG